MIKVIIKENDTNQRLDKFVRKYLPKAPLSLIYKLFRKKDIKVNKKSQKEDYIVTLDDEVSIYISDELLEHYNAKTVVKSEKMNFKIIYEDNNVLIINKPSNIIVHAGDDSDEDTLIAQVLFYLESTGAYNQSMENTFIPALVHRLDRNTTGIVVIGKTFVALQILQKAFQSHEGINKIYFTIVAGKLNASGKIEAPIKKDANKKISYVSNDGLSAISEYRPIKRFKDISYIEVKILTGRTHQIRVHMNYINHPLIGDLKYSNESADYLAKKYNMKNYLLHAKSIEFTSLTGPLEYLNKKVFIAPFWDKQLKIIKDIEARSEANE